MKLLDDLQSLDLNDIGRWPFGFRAGAVALTAVIAMIAGLYLFVYQDKLPLLEKAASEEQEPRNVFEKRPNSTYIRSSLPR